MGQPVPVRHGELAPAEDLRAPDIVQRPFQELENLWERMGHVLDPGWIPAPRWPLHRAIAWQPMVDIEETEDAYAFEVDLPGVKRDDITVEVRDRDLCITGEIKEKERTGVVRRQTRRTGSFSYRATLPSGVDPDRIEATMENGVLSVRIPKTEKAKPHKIEVK